MRPALVFFQEVKGGYLASDASRSDDPPMLHFQACIGKTLKSCTDKLPEAFEMASKTDVCPVFGTKNEPIRTGDDASNWAPAVVPGSLKEGDGDGS